MKLYEVTRWGNDVDGGDGPDTNYLVVAADHEQAAGLIKGEPKLDAITELGVCTCPVERAVVLRGPYIEHKLERGTCFTLWSWDHHGLEVWVPTARCKNGEATCHYSNGQLAASCCWREGKRHGPTQLWYPTGQLMYRGEHRRGKMVGLHEYWYDDGTQASRYEYFRAGVRYQQWDRYGQMVADAVEEW